MKHQRGLSLIELMIAILLGMILLLGVVQLFLSSKNTYTTQQGLSRVQETGRLAMQFIARDTRMAGYTGFRGRVSTISNTLSPITISNNYGAGMSVANEATLTAAGIAVNTGTVGIIILGALEGESSKLIEPATLGRFVVALRSQETGGCPTSTNTTRYNGLCLDDNLIIADYQKSIVFKPSKFEVSGANLIIEYLGSWGGNYLNYEEFFSKGAQVSAVHTHIYFIRTNPVGRPSLYRKVNGLAAEELFEGVSNINVSYNRYLTPNVYANAVGTLEGHWNNLANPIISINLEILVESDTDNIVEDNQIYSFGGQSVAATDKRLRKVFTSTIAMRNQIP